MISKCIINLTYDSLVNKIFTTTLLILITLSALRSYRNSNTLFISLTCSTSYNELLEIQWNLYLRDLSKMVRLIKGVSCLMEVVKIAQCLLTINIQRLICTLMKLHVVKEAIQSSSSSLFITNFNLFVNGKTLTDFSTYFKNVIQYCYCQFSPVFALIEVFNNRNLPDIQLILVSASAK